MLHTTELKKKSWQKAVTTVTIITVYTVRVCVCVLVAQLCPTLCNPMDCSPLGSSVHGILQARILKWVAISFCRRSSQSRDGTQVSCITDRFFFLPSEPPGKPLIQGLQQARYSSKSSSHINSLTPHILRDGHYVILIFTQKDTETYRCWVTCSRTHRWKQCDSRLQAPSH